VEIRLARVLPLRHRLVHEVADEARDDHQGSHREQPDDERGAHRAVPFEREREERDERDARHAVGLEAVGRGADRVAGVVARAVGDDARVLRIVLRQLEDDLHEIGADVGDLREDAAADAQRRRAERLTDREADEARPDQVRRQERQDDDHEEELDAHEEEADAHAAAQRDSEDGQEFALQARERGAAVRGRVDPDAEPRHAVAAEDAEHARREDDADAAPAHPWMLFIRALLPQIPEVEKDADSDQDPETDEKFALLEQVALAGLPDDVGDARHRLMDRQRLRLDVLVPTEERRHDADDQAAIHEVGAVHLHAEDVEIGDVDGRDVEIGLAGEGGPRESERGERGDGGKDRRPWECECSHGVGKWAGI